MGRHAGERGSGQATRAYLGAPTPTTTRLAKHQLADVEVAEVVYSAQGRLDNQLMPTLEVIGERFPSLSSAERQQTLVSACKQYLSENTKPLDVACSDALGRVSG